MGRERDVRRRRLNPRFLFQFASDVSTKINLIGNIFVFARLRREVEIDRIQHSPSRSENVVQRIRRRRRQTNEGFLLVDADPFLSFRVDRRARLFHRAFALIFSADARRHFHQRRFLLRHRRRDFLRRIRRGDRGRVQSDPIGQLRTTDDQI